MNVVETAALAKAGGDRPELVKPINWFNLLSWARQTAVVDKKYYHSQSRPFSTSRLWHLAFPNLSRPIFIVGSPRSGTTFLGSCIADIPEISYHFEPVATKAAARYVHSNEWSFSKASRFYHFVYGWLLRLHADGDLRFAEKTPRNCFLISFLHQAFPDAQFVHIIRDGRDAALSHSKKPWLQAASAESNKRESSGYRHGPYPRFWVESDRAHEFETTSDIHRCIWAWRRHVSAILEQAQTLPAAQYYELRYENLVSQPQQEAEQLLDYLGIHNPVSAQCLYQAFAHARADSVGGWQRQLSADQLQHIEQEAGPLLRRLGYSS
ncbi:sulfotransferase family protein [Nodosilinea nodulosa]|uniref:sulfotransferase family protein n=1 Tax=Nodosilinea nodulosa TaxID=416001 RepID=UPI0002E6D0B4|nr:sulfotransferase [Nodosilinea nodulosa]